MRSLIVAALAVLTLGGCVAVPASYPAGANYYSAPTVGVGIYSAPAFHYRHYRPHRHHRHHGHHGHRSHRPRH